MLISSPTTTSCVLLPSSSHALLSKAKTFAETARSFICPIITCVFAAVGSLVGAVTGGFVGLTDESGPIRGAGIGTLSGAIFAAGTFKSSLATRHSNESSVRDFHHMVGIVHGVLSKRSVREMCGDASRSAMRDHMTRAESVLASMGILDACYAAGLTRASVERIPEISITSQNKMDEMGNRVGCVVCLQDFEVRETVRCLPHCQHKFHVPCIDGWITRNGSCPLCRRDLSENPISKHLAEPEMYVY